MRKTGKFFQKAKFFYANLPKSYVNQIIFSKLFPLFHTLADMFCLFMKIFAIDFRENENYRFQPKCDHRIYSPFFISQFRHISNIAAESRQPVFIKSES
jgi:hypothetical protein